MTLDAAGPYSDGQFVSVDVAINNGEVAASATAYICRAGKSYDSTVALSANAGDCPVVAISAAMGESSRFGLPVYDGGTKARGLVTMGVGTAEWNSTADNSPLSLECGPDATCLLVVKVDTVSGGALYDWSTNLTFMEPDAFAGCASGAEGAPSSAGADRMLAMWSSWTLGQCLSGTDEASTTPPTPGEGDGVAAFAAGQVDLAYTAAGYDAAGFTPSERRSAVATPVALNAVVLAAAGGSFPTGDSSWPDGLKRPYTELKLTADEVATLLGQSQFDLQVASGEAVLDRNPELGRVYSTSSTASTPLALSSTSALSLTMTTYLDTLAPDAWRGNAAADNADRGVDANLGLAEVPFGLSGTLTLLSDTSLIERAVLRFEQSFSSSELGPQWVLTDLATATQLGLTPVSLPNAAGEYVKPTAESLAAAVSTMKPQADGTLAPDVTTTAAGAYPLTIVEYALAPEAPLVDAACVPRAETQELLEGWLTYITGPGQEALAAEGFVTLPSGLAGEAAEAVGRVGSGSTDCDAVTPTTSPGTDPTSPTTGSTMPWGSSGGVDTAPDADVSGDDAGGGASFDDDGGEGPGDEPVSGEAKEPTAEDREAAADAADEASVESPPLLGTRAVSAVAPPTSVLLIVLITSGTAFFTSGKPLPAGVRTAGRRVRGAAGAVAGRVSGLAAGLRPRLRWRRA